MHCSFVNLQGVGQAHSLTDNIQGIITTEVEGCVEGRDWDASQQHGTNLAYTRPLTT